MIQQTKWYERTDEIARFVFVFGLLAAAVFVAIKFDLLSESTEEPAGEYVSGEAIEEEEAKELALAETYQDEATEFSLAIPNNSWILSEGVYLGEDPQRSMTVGELLDHLEVLEKTIAECCGTQYIDPDAEENLTVMLTLRKKVMELEARILELEHR